jgi:FKBP-type peptidyl-prolyl cis-trans isomerase
LLAADTISIIVLILQGKENQMKSIIKAMFPLLLLSAICGCKVGEKAVKEVNMEDPKQAFSYALGLDVARSLEPYKDDIDLNAFMKALNDTLVQGSSSLTSQDAQKILSEHFQRIQEEKKKKNLEEGMAFLENNKSQPGVVTTNSGLQYQVITEGQGEIPKADNEVSVHYVGTLIEGKEFENSHTRGKPATFPVNRVIPGWTEVLQLMKVGSKYKIFVPPALGYGERGRGRVIEPNSTLIFEIELLSIVK